MTGIMGIWKGALALGMGVVVSAISSQSSLLDESNTFFFGVAIRSFFSRIAEDHWIENNHNMPTILNQNGFAKQHYKLIR